REDRLERLDRRVEVADLAVEAGGLEAELTRDALVGLVARPRDEVRDELRAMALPAHERDELRGGLARLGIALDGRAEASLGGLGVAERVAVPRRGAEVEVAPGQTVEPHRLGLLDEAAEPLGLARGVREAFDLVDEAHIARIEPEGPHEAVERARGLAEILLPEAGRLVEERDLLARAANEVEPEVVELGRGAQIARRAVGAIEHVHDVGREALVLA